MPPQDLTSGRGGMLSHHTGSGMKRANRHFAASLLTLKF